MLRAIHHYGVSFLLNVPFREKLNLMFRRVLKVFGDLQLAMVAKAGYFQGLKHISLYLVSDVSLALLSKLHLNLLTLQIFGGWHIQLTAFV